MPKSKRCNPDRGAKTKEPKFYERKFFAKSPQIPICLANRTLRITAAFTCTVKWAVYKPVSLGMARLRR